MSFKERVENWLYEADKWIFGGKSVEIVSPFPLQESIARLRSVTHSPLRFPWATEALIGEVRENWVCLQHVKSWQSRNSFRTVLLGSFQERDGQVVLKGNYSIHPIVKVFMGLWMGMLSMFMFACSASIVMEGQWDKAWVILILVGMGSFAGLLTYLGKSMSRKEDSWIADAIQRAWRDDEWIQASIEEATGPG